MDNLQDSFKMTELGPLPEEWGVVKFESAIIKKRIKVGKVKKRDYQESGKYPIIDQSQNHIAGYWEKDEDLYQGDLPVIIFGDHTRIFKFIDFTFVCGADGTKVLVPNTSLVYPLFFYFALSNLEIPSRGYNRHYHLLKEKQFPLPPPIEQFNIAFVLSTVQQSKEKTDNVISATKALKKSMMKHLFTYGPVSVEEVENVPLKEMEIGMVPEGWDVVRLGDYIVKTKQKDMRKTSDEFNYIDVSGIDRDNLRIISAIRYKGKNAPSRARKIVNEKDVIIATVRPTLKRIALIPKEFDNQVCSTAFCVLRGNEEINSHFLYFIVQRDSFIDELGKIQRGASYPAVTDSDVKNQKIPLPSIQEQQKIASMLSTVDEKIEKEENKKKALDELFKTLLHDLMTAKLRVNHLEVEA